MKIYLDVIFLLNFSFDFLLLLSVSILLRRNVKITRILLGALFGGLSIFILFLKINSFQLFIIKILISILMILISFNYKNLLYTLKNLLFLYMSSIILGGFLYFLNVEFSYKQQGLVFFHKGLSINVIFLVIFSPIIIYTYVRQGLKLKNEYANYYKIDLILKNNYKIKLNAFLDTGNKLKDPYFNKPIILIDKKIIEKKLINNEFILVPYTALNYKGMIKCYKANKLIINGIGERFNFLIGIINHDIKIDGVNCILNKEILEEKNDKKNIKINS